ncbi:hypothetical protein A4S06_01975 [Erysipelotrichaceae bacterium MTC7]|nr:hypothetical protein A4S06_01975 [Erysipelotrichaceae bacterium MTC7]
MKFAYLILGPFQSDVDHASIHNETAQIIGVRTIEEACTVAKRLQDEGISCIELCGAFTKTGAREVIHATNGEIPVGYVVHDEDQNEIYNKVFSR